MAMMLKNPTTGDFQSIEVRDREPCCIHAVWEAFTRAGYEPWCYVARAYELSLNTTTAKLAAANAP